MPFRSLLSFLWVLLSAGAWAQPGSGGPEPETSLVSVVSITGLNSATTNTASVSYLVTFNRDVMGLSPNNFALNVGSDLSGVSVSTVTGSGSSYTVVIGTGSGSGSLQLVLQNSTGITPLASNVPFSGETYQIDKMQPSASISSSAGSSGNTTSTSPIPVTVTFSESVMGFGAGDITVSNGTITGNTVTGSGTTYTFTVTPNGVGAVTVQVLANTAQDVAGNGNTASLAYSLTFQAPTLVVGPSTLPGGQQGTAYSQTLSATGGTAPYAYAITAGALPSGLSLNLSNGTISGTPTANGTFTFTVTATDNSAAPGPYSGSRSYTLTINPQPETAAPVVITPANNSFSNNRSVTAAGTAPAGSIVSIYIGNNLAGTTPTSAAGTFSYIIPGNAPDGTYTTSATAQSSGATASPRSNGNTFTIDGTAPTITLSSATVAGGTTSSAPLSFTATFNEPVTGFASSGITVSNGTVTSGPTAGSGNTYSFQVTPSAAGTVTVQVAPGAAQDRATNNNTASALYSLTFAAPTIAVAPASLPGGTQGTAYSQILTASGGTGPYTYAITAGALPVGLSLTSAGTLAGTPTANGTFTFTATAIDASVTPGPYTGSRSYSLTIAPQPVTAAPVVIVPANGSFISTPTPTYGGTAPAGATIRVYVDGVLLSNTTTANSAGNWAITQPVALTQGSHTVYATAQTNGSAVSANSTTNTFTVDSVRPTVAISSSAGASGSSTSSSPISYTITFSEVVTGFVAGDVSVTGGTLSGFSGSGATYAFNVTPSANGTVSVNIPANVAQDQAGNGNMAATTYAITYTQPVTSAPVVTAPAGGALVNSTTPIYTGTAEANSTVTVLIDDTSIGTTTGTGAGNWSLAQPTALTQGSHTVKATAQLSGQTVSVNSNENSFTIDTVAPTVVVTSTAGATGSTTGTSPIPFTVTFSEPVTGFVAADLSVSGGSVANFAGSGTSYTFEITPAADGLITIDVPANVAQDGANNGNAASTFSLTYRRPVTPTPVVVTPANGSVTTATKPTYTGTATPSASLTLVVDENVATSQTTTVNGSGNWTLTQPTDLAPGTHTVQARAQLSGQTASAYSPVNTFTVVVLPTVVTATPTGVSSSGATLGGAVTDAGAGTISERGVVYVAGNGTPTTSDTKVVIGAGTGSFTQAVTGLAPATTYAVRAYAINQAGTSYGPTQLVSTGNSLAITSVTPAAVCAGATISVAYTNASPGTPLTVYLNGPSTSNLSLTTLTGSQASGTITATIPADRVAGQYSVYLSGDGASSGSVTITVNAIPSAPTTTPVTVCQNTTPVSLAAGVTAAQGASLNWYTAATGGTASANAPVPPTSTVGTTTYYVSQVSNGCESGRAALTYTVNPLPGVTLTNDGPLSCTRPAVTLTAGGNGSAYRFSSGATPIGTGNQATVSMSGTYSVTLTDGNGCSATAQTEVGSDQSNPQAGLTGDGPLTCAKTTVTLTAAGNGSYRFSAGATPIGTGNQATVTTGGVYSLTVTAPNGCSATAQTTVEVNTTVAAPTLTASALSTENAPISVTASGCSGTINWTATGGTGTANGSVYTFTQPGNYGLTATCTVGTCTSPAAPSLTLQIRPGGFAIRGVELVRCQLVDAGRGQYEISFMPQYSGLSGSPVSFSVTNELAATTAPGPYTLRLYTDNATIGLVASQNQAQASYRYNWLAACSGSQPSPNRPPVAQPIPDQVLVVGQNYQLELSSYFADPDGQSLSFTATGLPAGLQLSGSRISGSPTQAGTTTVQLTALDPGGLQAVGSVLLRVDPAPVTPTPGVFSIAGVTGVRCETLSVGERQLSFSPVYTGLTGAPVSFGIPNELATTTAPGPYSLRLYTDNPAITLTATQNGTPASYRFSWLAACPTGSTTPPAGNRPPVVGTGLGNQTATAGQGYTLFIPAGTFTDPDNNPLQLTVSGLPAGLSFSAAQNAITGTPAQAGSSSVQVTATDPGGLSVSLSFVLTVQPATTPTPTPGVFSIAGVTGVRCETLSVGERQLSFSPVYTGLTGESIRFGVVNELATTTAPGPYTLRLYTDNAAITLTATQGSTQASYRFNWLAACQTNPNGRQAVAEAGSQLSVVVLGNPVIGESVEVVIGGAAGQAVVLSLTDLAGNRLYQQSIRQAAPEERVVVPVSAGQAITILKVSTATQQQTVKLIRQ